MTSTTTLSVIVPVYNEQFLVQESLWRLQVLAESPLLSRIQVIVVDDGSTDQTPDVLHRFQADAIENGKFDWMFLRHQRNLGKGAAIRTGIAHADAALIAVHDADLEYHPRDLLKMIPLFLENEADAVFGSRFLAGDFRRVLFFWHALGNHFLTFLCDLCCDLNLTDMEVCYKVVRTPLLQSIPLESSDFRIEPELTIKLAKRGARIFEVPISYSGRSYQEGKKIKARDGLLAIGAILKHAIAGRIYMTHELGSECLVHLNHASRFMSWVADTVRPYVGNRVLEINAGVGMMALNLMPRAVYWATDSNPLFLDDLRKLSRTRPYLKVAHADVANPLSFPAEQTFDTVVGLHVMERAKDDVAALQNIREVLEEHGRAIILVPQGAKLYGSMDRALGYYRRYTKEQLIAVGQRAGFRVREVLDFNRMGRLSWWLNSCVLRRTMFGLWPSQMLDLLIPLFRRLDPYLPLPALSLITILEKVSDDDGTGK